MKINMERGIERSMSALGGAKSKARLLDNLDSSDLISYIAVSTVDQIAS